MFGRIGGLTVGRFYIGCAFLAAMGILAIWKGIFGSFNVDHPLALRYCPIWVYRACCIIAGTLLLAIDAWFLVDAV